MEKTLHAEPAGNTVQFKCHAGGANLTVRWYKDGKEISTDPKRRAARLGSYKVGGNYNIHSQLLMYYVK